MFLGALLLVALLLLGANALLQRRTRRAVSGETSLAAEASLRHDGGGTREVSADVARQEMIHDVHRGMEQGG
jgi:hypothetical protein